MSRTDVARHLLPWLWLLTALPALAEQGPVNIAADHMQMQLETGSSIYTGNVTLSRDGMVLSGDRIVVDRPDAERMKVKVFGEPARFEQTSEATSTRAVSREMYYDSSTEILILEQDARLDHDRQIVESDRIRFDTANETLLAGGNAGAADEAGGDRQRVNIILEPTGGTP